MTQSIFIALSSTVPQRPRDAVLLAAGALRWPAPWLGFRATFYAATFYAAHVARPLFCGSLLSRWIQRPLGGTRRFIPTAVCSMCAKSKLTVCNMVAPVKSARSIFASVMTPPSSFARLNLAPMNSALSAVKPIRLAPEKSALGQLASDMAMPSATAFLNETDSPEAAVKSAEIRLAPSKTAHVMSEEEAMRPSRFIPRKSPFFRSVHETAPPAMSAPAATTWQHVHFLVGGGHPGRAGAAAGDGVDVELPGIAQLGTVGVSMCAVVAGVRVGVVVAVVCAAGCTGLRSENPADPGILLSAVRCGEEGISTFFTIHTWPSAGMHPSTVTNCSSHRL
mmetsp:Transcript_37205/g.86929  ORF Transcript_37205/g.86929 Transcript_37205/m.86929 type:complete len:336 (-) Transcript_37205:303-1310(-)